MKKIAVILLVVLYSTSTIGATIHMHYCMNKFAGWSLSTTKKDKCSKCGMTGSGCCKDESKQIKITTDQQNTDHTFSFQFSALTLLKVSNSYSNPVNTTADIASCLISHNPPLISKQGLFAFYSIFII